MTKEDYNKAMNALKAMQGKPMLDTFPVEDAPTFLDKQTTEKVNDVLHDIDMAKAVSDAIAAIPFGTEEQADPSFVFHPMGIDPAIVDTHWEPVTSFQSLSEMIEAYASSIQLVEDIGEARNAEVKKVLEPVQAVVDKINQDYDELIVPHRESLASLEAMIKAEVIKGQATIKSKRFMFVYNRGKKTWDGKRLEGYAAAHPEILAMQNVGEPTVSIRKV